MKCPCCGSLVEDVPIESLKRSNLGHLSMAVTNFLISKYPEGVSIRDIAKEVYNDRDSTPEHPVQVICGTIIRLRKALKDYGWTITGGMGGRASINRYRLEKLP